MRYKKLCKNGPDVSVIGFGAWGISGKDWGKTDDKISETAIHAALDSGVNFIDTADVYGEGHSDRLIKKVLTERKNEDIVVATKCGSDFYNFKDAQGNTIITPNYKKEYLIFSAEESLKRLGVETLDVLQLHSPSTDILSTDEPWEALYQLKKEGKIRFAGLSVQSFKENEQLDVISSHEDLLDVLQVRYNLFERGGEEKLFPYCEKNGIGIIARIPLLFGFLTGKFNSASTFEENDHRRFNLSPEKLEEYLTKLTEYETFFEKNSNFTKAQLSLGFVINHPAVSCAIPGGKTPRQISENIKASQIPSKIYSSLGH